jgi:hypothetical protein
MTINQMPEYPQVQIALYVIGESIDLTKLRDWLSAEPVVSISKGDPRLRVSTGELLGFYSKSTWGFGSFPAITSDEIDEHAEWLIAKAFTAIPVLCTTSEQEAFIEITLASYGKSCSCVLPPRLLELAAELRARIGVVIRHEAAGWKFKIP